MIGDYAYAANYNNGLSVIDISDPEAPALAGTFVPTPGQGYGVAADGTYAYLENYNYDSGQDLVIIDVTTPASPAAASYTDACASYNMAYGDVALAGDLLLMGITAEGVAVVDVSDRTAPVLIGTVSGAEGAVDVAVAGSRAYAACGDNGLVVIKLRGE